MGVQINTYQYEELCGFDSRYGLLESPRECGIEPPDSISHGVSYIPSSECRSKLE
jgi:hypothetical protein